MDNFAEQLVKRNETKSDKIRRIATIITGSLFTVCIVLFAFLQIGQPLLALMGFVLAVAAGYGTYFLVQGSYVEYEYTFTNGELDVDKIIARKKRTALLTVPVRTFTAFGKYTEDMEETEDMTVVVASDNIISREYYADFEHTEYGKTRLIFVPDERMLENIKKALPAKIHNELNK